MLREVLKMSKKKKKLKKLAESNIKILKSGKIKFSKNQKIDLSVFANESIEGTIVSRLNGIISKEDVVIDTTNLRCKVDTYINNDIEIAELSAQISKSVISEQAVKNSVNVPFTNTLIITVSKKNALDMFDFLNPDTIGVVLRSSTLAAVYSKDEIRDKWDELNNDNSSFTNVLYIPKVMMFIDYKTGEIRKTPYYINILIVAVPSIKNMSVDGVEEISEEEAVNRVIADIADSAIKCGSKNLIINPYGYKLFKDNTKVTADAWDLITSSQKFIENIDSVQFAINDEVNFIIFNAARNKLDVTVTTF